MKISTVPAGQLSRSAPTSLSSQQASGQHRRAAESTRNPPCSFTGPPTEGATRPFGTEHLGSPGRGQGWRLRKPARRGGPGAELGESAEPPGPHR